MSGAAPAGDILTLDAGRAALVRFAARIAGGTEEAMRAGAHECMAEGTPTDWVEELLLQSYLFCGFPRTLNATREWRRISQRPAPARSPVSPDDLSRWRADGERTCAVVYGPFYAKLRHNIEALHPDLDEWMIAEGYGKILSRPGMPLRERELCIVAACVASGQERQLHSHLHGALNAGAAPALVRATLSVLEALVGPDDHRRALLLFERVLGKA